MWPCTAMYGLIVLLCVPIRHLVFNGLVLQNIVFSRGHLLVLLSTVESKCQDIPM